MDGNSAAALDNTTKIRWFANSHAQTDRQLVGEIAEPIRPAKSTFAPPLSAVVMVFFSVGLGVTLIQTDAPDAKHGIDQLLILLPAVNVCLALVASWVAFLRWRHDGDLLASRLAVAIPSLYWVSHAIVQGRHPEHLLASTAPSSIIGIAIGAVGTGLIAAHAVGRGRALTNSLTARVLVCTLSFTGIAIALNIALRNHSALAHGLRVTASTIAFPTAWSLLGVLLLLKQTQPRHRRIDRCLGALLLLLSVGQITKLPGHFSLDQQAAFGTTLATIALIVLLVGLGHELRLSYEEQQRALIAIEIDRAVAARQRTTELLHASRRTHDQRASLLSVEAVIRVLEGEGSASLDPLERRRLSGAATAELQRLRSLDEPTFSTNIDVDLRTVLDPVVSLARADGANVTMNVRPGLMARVTPTGIEDVMRNLILNAVQHGGNSAIVVEARRLDYEFIEFSVSDRGPGVSPLRRFDLFEAGRTSGGHGRSGLGLDSARSILRSMGGDLSLDRSYSLGARFVGKIPVARDVALAT